jgi:hypothetical protein
MLTLRYATVFLIFNLGILTGCSTPTEPKKPAASPAATKVPTLYTAKQCFGSMVNLAERWSPDGLPFHMESELNSEATGQEGKATVWRAYFASPGRGTAKIFTCSGSRLSGAPALGFSDTPESPYAANTPGLMFEPAIFIVDSDKAYAVTLEHGGEAFLRKDPKQPVLYRLDWDKRKKQLVWWVVYGKSETDRQGLCVIDAKTGAFISAGR